MVSQSPFVIPDMITGNKLNQAWKVGAKHALYRRSGDWYHRLERFPGALFDLNGYVLFKNRREFISSRYLQIKEDVHVPGGIARIPIYINKRNPPETLATVGVWGAGFGTPEQNRLVEKAACKAVKGYFRKCGYKISSREKECLGYDFDVSRNRETLHVEVKGISGSELRFPITANEIASAKSDPVFQLAVVTHARSKAPTIQIFGGKRFLQQVTLRPLAFYAELGRQTDREGLKWRRCKREDSRRGRQQE